jgi:hypothetical protein
MDQGSIFHGGLQSRLKIHWFSEDNSRRTFLFLASSPFISLPSAVLSSLQVRALTHDSPV